MWLKEGREEEERGRRFNLVYEKLEGWIGGDRKQRGRGREKKRTLMAGEWMGGWIGNQTYE